MKPKQNRDGLTPQVSEHHEIGTSGILWSLQDGATIL